jgi:hypothetical protein
MYALAKLLGAVRVFLYLCCAISTVASFVTAAYSAIMSNIYRDAAASSDDREHASNHSNNAFDLKVFETESKKASANSVYYVLQAVISVTLCASFLFFFPAALLVFRRAGLRLSRIIEEIGSRTDAGNILLPFEFSPKDDEGNHGAQIEMNCGKAREFLDLTRKAAFLQMARFNMAGIVMSSFYLFLSYYNILYATSAFNSQYDPSCDQCGSCQSTQFLIKNTFIYSMENTIGCVSLRWLLFFVLIRFLMVTKRQSDRLQQSTGVEVNDISLPQANEFSSVCHGSVEDLVMDNRGRMGVDFDE